MRARAAGVIFLGLVLVGAGLAFYVSSTATATLAIRVRDVPVAWSHVVVTFSEVSVHPADTPNGSVWVDVALQTSQVDFLALGNLTTLLALDRVAPGTYTQVRIFVSSARGVLASGTPVVMSVPDGVLKTTTPFTLQGGATTTVTLDFNLAQSIIQAGAAWVFTPVLGPIEVG